MNYVEIWDVDGSNGDKYIGLFRIMPSESLRNDNDNSITYTLEHVLSTLIDDTMLGWHEIGNLGIYTKAVINYILGQQNIKRWRLGSCDYNHQYLYGWQDENLLSGLFSITKPFIEDDYRWEFDTKAYPWTLSLKRASPNPVVDIRYKKNMNGIKKTVDPSNLLTRLYCYGYGEADNRLTIKSVNNGMEYLDSPNIAKYGVITRVWTDERFTNEQSLLEAGKAMLNALDESIISYEVDAAVILKAADLEAGDMVRVVDTDIDLYTRVVQVSKDDVSGGPLSGKIILANKDNDIIQSTADLVDRQRIAATYSQGSESIFVDSSKDEADEFNPAEITFVVPENTIHVNEVLLSAKLTAFRATSKATKGGGSTTQTSGSGGATSVTSESGGSSQQSSSSGGESQQSTSNGGSSQQSSSSGGDSTQSSSSGGSSEESTSSGGDSERTSSSGGSSTETSSSFDMTLKYLENTVTNDNNRTNHNHGISRETKLVTDIDFESGEFSYVEWVPSGAHTHGEHSHEIDIPSHRHTVNIPSHRHTVDIPSHRHEVDIPSHQHTVDIPSHQHSVDIPSHQHTVDIPDHEHIVDIPEHTHDTTLPDHTHDIQYGIYKGPSANRMTIQIDDVLIGTFDYSVSLINLVPYMNKKANGNVLRGEHIIKITSDTLTRIEWFIQIRLFTNSHGSGQY